MFDKLDFILEKYEELSQKVSDPEIINNQAVWQKHMKEMSEMEPIVNKYREYKKAKSDLSGAKEMLDSGDEELRDMAKLEISELDEKLEQYENELKILLLPKDPNDDKNYVMLTDIQGIEDFFGDMDFKVGGTEKGITAIQVDIKVDGLSYDIIAEAFERTKNARKYILDEIMTPVISEPRKEISKYAPKIVNTKISVDKIKDVIGPGGKMINKIIDETGVKIDIEEDGSVFIYAVDGANANKALEMIDEIAREIEVGKIYKGTVTRLMTFGAFVAVGGGKEGLVHKSKITKERVEKVEDFLKIGQEVMVKVTDIDDQGRINLTMRYNEENEKEEKKEENTEPKVEE